MVKVKLSEKYVNEFLTTHNGHIFYSETNKLGKEANVIDVDLNNLEIANLLEQGILKLAIEEDSKMQEPVKTIKENTPVNKIDNKLKTEDIPKEEPQELVVEDEKEE